MRQKERTSEDEIRKGGRKCAKETKAEDKMENIPKNESIVNKTFTNFAYEMFHSYIQHL